LWLDEYRQLHSTNTDVEGFIANLDDAVPSWDRGLKAAMVLGAGGAARAVVFGLIERGVQTILLANRTPDRAIALQAQFGPRVKPIRWDQINTLLRGAGLVVNTTTLGMTGQPALVCDLRQLSPEAIVADIVYAPLDTALLKAARARGLRTADGLGMLLHQAVGGFERWFGVRPRVTADLRARIEAGLMRRD
jgi:shikimate dehydrogenase